MSGKHRNSVKVASKDSMKVKVRYVIKMIGKLLVQVGVVDCD